MLEGKITRLKNQTDVEALAQQILDKKEYDFYDIEGEKFDENGREELEAYLFQDTGESLSETFRNFDIDQSPDTYPSGYSYYKEGKLHLFMSVPHVFGDFIELRFQ